MVAIAVRPSFTPADAAMLDLVPSVPRPDGPPRQARAVRRAKPRAPRNTIRPRFLTDATRELFDRLGPTERRVIAGSVILRWDLGEGDGMIVARKSSDEGKGGETIGGQLDAAMKYCDASGRKPRIVHRRRRSEPQRRSALRQPLDFTEVFDSFTRGEVEWVVYRGMDRIARSMTWTTLFVHYLYLTPDVDCRGSSRSVARPGRERQPHASC